MKKLTIILSILSSSLFLNAQRIPSWKITELADYYDKKSDSIYVINFWTINDKPGIIQIPSLQNITSKYSRLKVKLLLVSLDRSSLYPRKIKKFAKQNNFTAEVIWLDESEPSHFSPVIDEKWSGSTPATLIVNPTTGYRKFMESSLTEPQFEKELRLAIGTD